MTSNRELSELVIKHVNETWSIAQDALDADQVTFIDGKDERSTIAAIFELAVDASNSLAADETIRADIKAHCNNYLFNTFKMACYKIGLITNEDSAPLPLERLLRRVDKHGIDLLNPISKALADDRYEANDALGKFAIKALKLGKPELTLAIADELTSSGKAHYIQDTKDNVSAFLNALYSVVNAPTVAEANRLQDALINLMDTMEIDTEFQVKGVSISEFCDGEPALSLITSKLNNNMANRIILESSGDSLLDDKDVVYQSNNRSF